MSALDEACGEPAVISATLAFVFGVAMTASLIWLAETRRIVREIERLKEIKKTKQ